MKGLLIKDFSVLTRQMRIFLVMIVVFAMLPSTSINLSYFAVIYAAMMPYTSLAYDERSKWDQLAGTMPYSKKEIVLSKYILGWCFIAATALIALAAGAVASRFYNNTGYALGIALSVCVAVIMMDITLPAMFRIGVERGRMFFTLIMVLLACSAGGLVGSVIDTADAQPLLRLLNLIFPAAAVILTFISIPLSAWLYARRDR